MNLYALIMAGGIGTRLWPHSQPHHPKQFLQLTGGERTMLQETQNRLSPLISSERVLMATNREYTSIVTQQLPGVPVSNILGEPEGKGTAAAIGLAAVHLRRRDPSAIMAVVTADHAIQRPDIFLRALTAASDIAGRDWLVTLGIHPTYPETGYGYIQRGISLETIEDFEVFQVARFAEKPNLATAEQFVQSKEYAWNSGMFVWKVEQILAEIERYMPDLYTGLQKIEQSIGTADAETVLAEVWPRLATQTIDYGIMEKAQHVAVLPVEIGWNDVGSWAAVYDVLEHDPDGNAIVGQHLAIDTHNTLVFSPQRLVATIGLEDLIVVDTEEIVLICPRSRAQEVKQLVAMMRHRREDKH